MTTAILVFGLLLAFALAILMVDRERRLPALAFGLLALPGNVDDLLPQMRLDPHEIVDNMAAAVSTVDLLLVWSLILTVREGRRPRIPKWIFALVGVVAALAVVSAAVALVRGVEPLAAVRGATVFARIVAMFFLAGSLAETRKDASRLALAFVGGGVVLIGNGLYTSTTQGLDRFTATTFGRNGFGVALIVCAVIAAGVVFTRWDRLRASGREALTIAAAATVAGVTLFSSVATGTRISMVALVSAAGLMLTLNTEWRSAAGLRRVTAVAVVTIAVIGAASILTAGGGRAISLIPSAQEAVRGVTDHESLPVTSAVRTRGDFWYLAARMAARNPVFGVGPFQWNFERYELTDDEPQIADPHNSYLQVAAEYGILTGALYVVLVAACLLVIFVSARRSGAIHRTDWTVASVAGGALAFALADVTNSNLFNPRMGLVEWLLMAVAVTYAAPSVRERKKMQIGASRATAHVSSSDRGAPQFR